MKISVIMLTYNREALIGRAIDSILTQTLKDFEFIIVNNGSSDSSGAIADKYAGQDNRIQVIHRERGNISQGRNTGLNIAKGDYIAFIDDDDWAEPGFLSFLYALATENDADVAICGDMLASHDEKRIMNPEEALITLMERSRYNTAFPTKLFKSTMFADQRFPEDTNYDDIALMYKMLAKANRVVYHGLPKYTFYRHEGNNSAWVTNHSLLNAAILREYLYAYNERTRWLSEIFPRCAADFNYFEWSFMISMVEKISRLQLEDCYPQREIMLARLRANKGEFMNSALLKNFEKKWIDEYL